MRFIQCAAYALALIDALSTTNNSNQLSATPEQKTPEQMLYEAGEAYSTQLSTEYLTKTIALIKDFDLLTHKQDPSDQDFIDAMELYIQANEFDAKARWVFHWDECQIDIRSKIHKVVKYMQDTILWELWEKRKELMEEYRDTWRNREDFLDPTKPDANLRLVVFRALDDEAAEKKFNTRGREAVKDALSLINKLKTDMDLINSDYQAVSHLLKITQDLTTESNQFIQVAQKTAYVNLKQSALMVQSIVNDSISLINKLKTDQELLSRDYYIVSDLLKVTDKFINTTESKEIMNVTRKAAYAHLDIQKSAHMVRSIEERLRFYKLEEMQKLRAEIQQKN